jgi:hypothetical protein
MHARISGFLVSTSSPPSCSIEFAQRVLKSHQHNVPFSEANRPLRYKLLYTVCIYRSQQSRNNMCFLILTVLKRLFLEHVYCLQISIGIIKFWLHILIHFWQIVQFASKICRLRTWTLLARHNNYHKNLKGQCHGIFDPQFFSSNNHP